MVVGIGGITGNHGLTSSFLTAAIGPTYGLVVGRSVSLTVPLLMLIPPLATTLSFKIALEPVEIAVTLTGATPFLALTTPLTVLLLFKTIALSLNKPPPKVTLPVVNIRDFAPFAPTAPASTLLEVAIWTLLPYIIKSVVFKFCAWETNGATLI